MSAATVFLAALAQAAPIALAALGGVISERAGVINFALEGMMLTGAFAGVWASHATGNPWLGLVAAVAAGVAVGLVHAAASLWLRVNQVISALAANILATGLTGALLWRVFGQGTTPSVPTLPALAVGGHAISILAPAPFLLAPILWVFLRSTRMGLRLRASGESASVASAAGVRVTPIRFGAVLASGALAGAAGAYLSIGILSTFTAQMTGGRGYMAVAAVIFGKWNPLGALAAAVLFGFFNALGETLSGRLALPSDVYLALPYILTLAALAGFVGKSRAPADLGRLPAEA